MSTPQPGIFAATQPHQLALEYRAPWLVAAALARTRRALAGEDHVLALGAGAYRRLGGGADTADLEQIVGMANTPRDVLVWMQNPARDRLFDAARAVDAALGAECALEVAGFIYRDSRDLTGFIDGTANPKDDAARRETALVPAGAPGAGGSHVLTQKWRHDLSEFQALPVEKQERIIGRTKADSVELPADEMPAHSHVSRTDAKRDGVAQTLWRRSFPWGGVSAHGLYFLAFSRDAARYGFLLRRMFGATEDGVRDRLTRYSASLTGALWFAPPVEELDRLSAV